MIPLALGALAGAGSGGGLGSLAGLGLLTGGMLGSSAISSQNQPSAPQPKKWQLGVSALGSIDAWINDLIARMENQKAYERVMSSFEKDKDFLAQQTGSLINAYGKGRDQLRRGYMGTAARNLLGPSPTSRAYGSGMY
jgi:hypothetical protein